MLNEIRARIDTTLLFAQVPYAVRCPRRAVHFCHHEVLPQIHRIYQIAVRLGHGTAWAQAPSRCLPIRCIGFHTG